MIRTLALAGLLCPLGEAPAAALEGEISFRVDARLELLSAAVGLAAREGLAPGWEGEPYAREAHGHFVAWASHPVVGRLSRIIAADPRGDSKIQGFMLHLSSPPQLALRASPPEDLVEGLGGEKVLEALLAELRDFARRTEFGRFFESHASDYERFTAAARREVLQAQSPSSVAAYLGSPGSGRLSFLLAVLMPPGRASATALGGLPEDGEPRLRPARRFEGGVPVFGLDLLDASPAHELARSVLVENELALAVTLRALALDLGEAVYRERLRGYEARYPYLAALGQALKRYETQGRGQRGLRELKAVLPAAGMERLPGPEASPDPPEDPELGRDKALGVQAFLNKDFKAALEHLRRAQARAPQDLETQLNLGVVYSEIGEAGQSLAWYGRVISAKPASSAEETVLLEALSSRASLLETLRRPQEARADLERALNLAPADWARRGETLARLRSLAR